MTPRLQLVRDDAPLAEPDVRLSRCERCGCSETLTRSYLDGSWRSRHVCRPNDTMDWRVIVAGLLGSAVVVGAFVAAVALARTVLG